jgi:hypothetical protein
VIDYYNSVRELLDLGSWDGAAGMADLATLVAVHGGVALIAQERATGRVIALGRHDAGPPQRPTADL